MIDTDLLFPKLIRFIVGLLFGFILILIIGFILFEVNKDQIKSLLLDKVNNSLSGELIISDIHFSPFSNLPDVSIRIDSAHFYETKSLIRHQSPEPVLSFNKFFISFHLFKLITGELSVSGSEIEGGKINLLKYDNQSINLWNAMQSIDSTTQEDSLQHLVSALSSEINIKLENITMKDVRISFADKLNLYRIESNIQQIFLQFNAMESLMNLDLEGEMSDVQLNVRETAYLPRNDLHFDLSVTYDQALEKMDINKGYLTIEGLKFNSSGSIDAKNDMLDIHLDASDAEMTILSFLLDEELANYNANIWEKGTLEFAGSITGTYQKDLPLIQFDFDMQDYSLALPEKNDFLKNVTIEGSFSSGTKFDLSESSVAIDNFQIQTWNGYIHGNTRIQNLLHPFIDLNIESETSINGFEELIQFGQLDSLYGDLNLNVNISGEVELDSIHSSDLKMHIDLAYKDLGFRISGNPGFKPILNGRMRGKNGLIEIGEFKLSQHNTEVDLTGKFEWDTLTADPDSKMTASFQLTSKHLLLEDFPYFDSAGFIMFHHPIENLSTDLSIETYLHMFKEDNQIPDSKIKLSNLSFDAADLPEIEAMDVELDFINDTTGGFLLDISNLEINTSLGNAHLSGNLLFPDGNTMKLITSGEIDDARLLDIITLASNRYDPEGMHNRSDTINTIKKFQSDLDLHFHFRPFSIEEILITRADIDYYNKKGENLRLWETDLSLHHMVFDIPDSSLLYGISSFDSHIEIKRVETPWIKDVGVEIDANANEKVYAINFITNNLMVDSEEGQFIYDLNESVPVFHLSYNAGGLKIEKLLSRIYGRKIMTGNVGLGIDLTVKNNDFDFRSKAANGNVIITGEDLVVYGIDIDDFLKRYRKSQNFNLTDVGALFVLGPFGPVLTKGYSFTSLLSVEFGDTIQSNVPHFIAHWELNDGILETNDVAFSTLQNRMAIKGKINLPNDSIESIVFAVLDKKGCSLLDQKINGKYDNLTMGKVNIVGTLLGSIVNLMDAVVGNECDPFYQGSLEHPQK